MIIRFKFTSFDGQIVEGMRTELDRNYPDEETALILVEDEHHADTDGYFELNIRKDKDGRLTQDGYVAEYESSDEAEAAHITELTLLEVTEHDFDETLREANETLQPFGKRIVTDYDGEGYWSVGSTDMDGSNPDWYADADFEHEVRSSINECLAHVLARVKNPELWQQGQDKMAQIRQLWESLTGMEQVDLMVEFYYGLMDAEKDRFLSETENG